MRIDRDPELLAAEVRRLRAVIAAGAPTLTDEDLWGDKYLDVPEDFAIRALALGFLP